METVPACNIVRSNLSSESISVSAARELVPTPVVTRSGAAIPEVGTGPKRISTGSGCSKSGRNRGFRIRQL